MAGLFIGTEEHRNAPQTGETHQRIDNAGEHGHLAAAQERHRVEAKQADTALVQGADDGQDQCNFINHHEQTSIHALRQGLSLDCPLLAKPYMNGTFCGWNCKRQGNVL